MKKTFTIEFPDRITIDKDTLEYLLNDWFILEYKEKIKVKEES